MERRRMGENLTGDHMTERPPDRIQSSGWLALALTALLVLVTWSEVVWLLWRYVPAHAAMLAGLGLPLSMPARVVIVLAMWFIRLLPLVLLALLMAGPGLVAVAVAVGFRVQSKRRFVGWLISVGLLGALTATLASGFVVASLYGVYRAAARAPQVEERVRAPRECAGEPAGGTTQR
jgi:hypothetical protein